MRNHETEETILIPMKENKSFKVRCLVRMD